MSSSLPNPGPQYTREQAYDLALLAICIWREARGESSQTQLGVAWSIRNRVYAPVKEWWGSTWEEVILKPWQYTSFSPKDPNAVQFGMPGQPAWESCLQCAERAYLGLGVDPVSGATHYYDTSIPAPPWATAPGTTFIIELGKMRFYKAA